LCDTAGFVRTTTGVTPRSFLADGGQRFFRRFRRKKTEIFAHRGGIYSSSVIKTTENSFANKNLIKQQVLHQINYLPADARLPACRTLRSSWFFGPFLLRSSCTFELFLRLIPRKYEQWESIFVEMYTQTLLCNQYPENANVYEHFCRNVRSARCCKLPIFEFKKHMWCGRTCFFLLFVLFLLSSERRKKMNEKKYKA